MDTIILDMRDGIEENGIHRAGEILKSGGLVAFPTETVYGLGADALNAEAAAKIYQAKGRPSDNPLIVHIADVEALDRIAAKIPEEARKLAKAFWPGPLTMIFQKTPTVPYGTTGGLDTVAVRMPDHEIALALIRSGGGYIAAPSANTSGRPSPTTAQHVAEDMNGRIDMILDGGHAGIGVESTIVDLSGEVPMILRPGYINRAMLEQVIGPVEVDPTLLSATAKGRPKAPGMRYKHYAPKADMMIVEGEQEAVIRKINELVKEELSRGGRPGIIASDESRARYHQGVIRSMGSRSDELSISGHLYEVLREFDTENVTKIFSEAFDTPDMGMAIMNRLMKAAGHQILQV
ncbi:MAG: L-threonylcarbamoyladenylate synthase [Eubacteriales bacterium]|nr:L-threonylcarbamoyladenylate synthase [Eubacteriales bacterium]